MTAHATKSPASLLVGVKDRRALIAIDLGAESCRISLLRWQDDLPRIQLIHRFSNRTIESANGLHWDLPGILLGLHAGLHQCAQIAGEGIRSIAVAGWAVDYVRLYAHGQPAADPFCYRDERTEPAPQLLEEGERSVHRLEPEERCHPAPRIWHQSHGD